MRRTTPSTSAPALLGLTIPSPIGPLTLVASADGLVAVQWPDDGAARVRLPGPVETVPAGADPVLDAAATQLTEYFDGTRSEFDLPLAAVGTEFQRAAWAVLSTIPFGTTTTYGEQARRLGEPSKARAVGSANGKNPLSIVVPCHRVVGADGRLVGFAGGLDTKRWLIEHERRVVDARSNG
jgi:methylated-DNA-[protein]-cysteine S-methyltransferase